MRFRVTLWGLWATHAVHLRLIGKRIVYFLYVMMELFSVNVMLRRYKRKSIKNRRFGWGWISFDQTFAFIFPQIDMPMDALQLCR